MSLHPAFRHRSSLALNIPLYHSRLLICLCSAQIQQLKSVVLWWVLCSAFIPSELMSSGISEQAAMPSSPGFPAPLPACCLFRSVSCSLQGSLQCPLDKGHSGTGWDSSDCGWSRHWGISRDLHGASSRPVV